MQKLSNTKAELKKVVHYFSSKNMVPGLPRFHVSSTSSGQRKNVFSTL